MKTKGIYFLYRVLQAFALPALLLYFVLRSIRSRGYWHSLPERFGFLPRSFRQTGPGGIWLHAVSVGEVLACVGLLKRLREAFPHSGIFVSTSTLSGRKTAADQLSELADGIFYAPVDYVFAVRRVLRTLRPSVVAVAETEIWPNLFREAKRTGAGLMMVNGRISDRAFPLYLRWRTLFEAVLALVDVILAQAEGMRERFLRLGAPQDRVRTSGNFKYDFEARAAGGESPVVALLEKISPRRVWVAASTMAAAEAGDPDEDDAVIAAFQQLAARHPELVLLLVPRKPERFDLVADKLERAGVRFVRRSALPDGIAAGATPQPPFALLVDSIGELSGLFATADVVFMGGTLASRGGHNILEPAFFAKPVVIGPHMENFRDIADEFRAAGACVAIDNAAGLAPAVERLLSSAAEAEAVGRRGLECAQARRGATWRAVAALQELYRGHIPRYRPAMPWYAMRWPLAQLWKWGNRREQRRGRERRRSLDIPVISVGNLTMGGTGKTPCVLRVAELLKQNGHRPGILTRGYKRGSTERHLVLAPGAQVRAAYSGDEPQIFVRSGVAPVGIGGNRYETGTLLRRQFDVDWVVLDDGFQHWRLERDVDLVLIDALDPFGGGEVFPLGRLREPLDALKRAGVVVITRSDVSDLPDAIEHCVRQWNPGTPVFRAHTRPLAWVENRSGQPLEAALAPFARAGAFCGLGNPQSFLRTLNRMGVEPVDWIEFEDHHRYRPHELKRLAHHFQAEGATALVTTQKDAVNLCEGCDDLLAPLPLFWLKIGMEVENEGEFYRVLTHETARLAGPAARMP